jgi:hypothetical protein
VKQSEKGEGRRGKGGKDGEYIGEGRGKIEVPYLKYQK